MANYIVDASVIADFLVEGNYTTYTETLILSEDSTTNLLVPEFCLLECTNVLWKRVRFHNMPQERAEILIADLSLLPLIFMSVSHVLTRALQIGVAHRLAIYDSVYIALAEKYGYPLITADGKQETAARAVGVTIKPITEF